MDYFVDSNIFLRVLVKENEKTFKECYQFLKLVENKEIAASTSALILAEVDWVLESFYGFSKERAVEALESINKLRGLYLISDKINLPLCLKFYKENKVKFIDALIACQPPVQAGKITIVSYDNDFDKLKVKRKEPSDFLKN